MMGPHQARAQGLTDRLALLIAREEMIVVMTGIGGMIVGMTEIEEMTEDMIEIEGMIEATIGTVVTIGAPTEIVA